jgi:hypothetical protein
MTDVQTFQVDPAAHEQAAAGTIPYTPKTDVVATKPAEPAKPGTEVSTAPAAEPDKKAEGAAKEPAAPTLKIEEPAQPEVEEPQGLDFDAFSNEIHEKGSLSPESMQAVKEAYPGLPDHIINAYVEGLKSLQKDIITAGHALAGGEANYKAMAAWARENLSQEERQAYHEAIDSNPHIMKMAIEGLRAKWEAAGAAPQPDLSKTGKTVRSGEGPLQSRAQLKALLADERYKRDPAFRADVERQLARSMTAGNYAQ